ncbi:unnamed protein product [Rotaria sp. Silwood1]|nr:unnamed protein product [Rotaria sp. Silwood1]CAF1510952.1 unnamed protein product [Rotaria sp. Silwood1]CAF1513354.1 unnamed protein product [Rotaria sp. Silwood1]CAF3616737.1 unnamed protein product [Rotaria sp. Silwood1]CAF3713113.1 unnamed protein product [Rotaria sp. Silwood1]
MNETAPVSKIYDEEISKAQFSPELLASVPLIHEIESGLNYPRRKLTPILPTSAVFDIPDSYHTTASGEKFLFCDTFIGRKKRMLLFGSPKQLELLFDSSIVLMDGTFSSTPPYFDQTFTLHCLKFDCRFHSRFNRRIQRAHANIWSFITCLVGEERQFQHTHIRITTGAQRRPKSNAADGIQKRINVLNKQYNQQKIDAEQLLESLSMLVGKK